MEIKKIDGTILYTCDCEAIADALSAAVKSGANLSGANLSGTDLRGANLGDSNLYGANLRGANLRGANLHGANLRFANLGGADLHGANLRFADLYGADLRGADLRCAYLRFANLGGANLYSASLYGANLGGADLRCANLGGANLGGASLYGAKNIPYIPLACPSDGEFTAWKKVSDGEPWLVELKIPADARRSSATTTKCRCDKALVVAITSIDGKKSKEYVINKTFVTTSYKVGETVYPDSFDENRWNECSNGIHFFINKQDAINY